MLLPLPSAVMGLHSELKFICDTFNFFEPGGLFWACFKSISIGRIFLLFLGGSMENVLLSTQTTSLLTYKSVCKLVFVCIYEICFMFRKRVLKMIRICSVFIVLCQLIFSYTPMIDCRNESKFFFSVGVVFFVGVDRCLKLFEESKRPLLSVANCCANISISRIVITEDHHCL